MSLFVMASALFVIMLAAGLSIDLVSLYVGRSEAQRAADAGALAGATVFANSSCTTGTGGCSNLQTAATNEAIKVADTNLIGGQQPVINSSPGACSDVISSTSTADIGFLFTPANDPRICVKVHQTMPTYFMKIWGWNTISISATATAEAYNPTSTGPPTGTYCVKPWLLPNCDYNHMVSSGGNTLCPAVGGQYPSYFVTPGPGGTCGTVTNPTGVINELMTIKPGNPSQSAAPSQFYPVILPAGSTPAFCPSCSNGGGSGGAALYRQNIECCNTSVISCGTNTLQPETGNVVGPTKQGVDCLIHEGNNGTGQDVYDPTTGKITAGANNPLVLSGQISAGQAISASASNSVVSMPVFDGKPLCPGKSCNASVNANIVGFIQIFVKDETNPQGTVEAYVMNVVTCGCSSGGSGGGGTVTGGGLSTVPVRLVCTPGLGSCPTT